MKARVLTLSSGLRTAGLITTCTALLLMLTGCAAERSFRFAPQNVSRIQYDPRSCAQLPDGRFLCKQVVFTVAAVDVGHGAK
jgi:hypothetical protein